MKIIKDSNFIDNQVDKYIAERPLYESYSTKLRNLLLSLLDAHELKYQVVEARAKDAVSFREKITRAGKSYDDPISNLPDLCGARIIVYYADDVPKVAKMISSEFNVIEEVVSHQPEAFEADRFGYLSLHFVVKLSNGRSELAEWKFASKFQAEIQVRTVIQHAWSAVSHALQYKQETAIPSKLRRRLFRIAGLFELADEEFVGIRDAKGRLSDAAAAAFAEGNKNIPISLESIQELTSDASVMRPLIESASRFGLTSKNIEEENNTFPEIYEISRRLGLRDIAGIEAIITKDHSKLFEKIIERMKSNWNLPKDFLIFFALLSEAVDFVSINELGEFGWNEDRADILISAAKSAKTS
ncbi:hypothetical protein IFT54_07825 [Sphingomonas sp. CFBP 13714]|uniref:GTP pyrophosphokinase n=1 Tax=Sphingomonas sp. CFBP 13714 TaxID=2775308 RepID=UPI00177DF110|nr:hypothetical protein [Sphingomonas sp. CFBP 13714]MBD8699722.1 hypothetical protein [Sphingomonas sp. CFBP 13714]